MNPAQPSNQPDSPQDSEEVAARAAVEAAIGGDSTRVGALLETYRPRLERMLAFRMDLRLSGRVEPGDVLQEAFSEIYEHLADWQGKSDLGFFLWVRLQTGQKLNQVHRRHIDVEARDARLEVPLMLQTVPGASSFAIASALIDSSNTPSRVAMKNEAGNRLHLAIESMKEIDREVLVMRHFEMLTNKEVARVLELTEPGATLRYVRALARLRVLLEELDIAPGSMPPNDG